MIKKVGCSPCKKFEPIVKKEAEKHSLGFRRIMQEDMPEEIRPSYFPYFYLYKEGEWGPEYMTQFIAKWDYPG